MRIMRFMMAFLCLTIASTMAFAGDYTTFLNSGRGFTEVKSTDAIIASADYYYILAPAESNEFIVGVGRYEDKPDWASEESKALRYKSADTDPVLDLTNFFTIEKSGNYIGLRNVIYNTDMFQTHDGKGYMYVNTYTDKNFDEWSYLIPTFQNGYWLFENGKYPMSSNAQWKGYMGSWTPGRLADNEPIALNRLNTNDDPAGHYRLFRIAKDDLKNIKYASLLTATSENPVDATWLITNPSFETGDETGWTLNNKENGNNEFKTRDYGMSNKDGLFLMNGYQWWAPALNVSQTVDVPRGTYTLSGIMATWTGREVTLSGNAVSQTATGQGDGTGITLSLDVTVDMAGKLTIRGGSTAEWWNSGHEGETQTFFKLDNVQLKCKHVDDLPLPNDFKTVLQPNLWYYYDVPFPSEYWVNGNISNIIYTTNQNEVLSNSGTPQTFSSHKMIFNKGRIYFKTTSNDATLRIEPYREVEELGEFTAVALNVDGLPQKIFTYELNPDGPGSDGTKKISQYLASKGYDFIGCSEDFNYHGSLISSLQNDYSWGSEGATLSVSGITLDMLLNGFRFDTDGLNLLWKISTTSANEKSCIQWDSSQSGEGNQFVKKGYRHYEMTNGGQTFDVFILHMDAGGEDYANSREGQWRQLAAAINNTSLSRPKLIIGDTNSRWTREDMKTNFMDQLNSNLTASDVWVEFYRDGVYPTTDMGDLTNQSDPTNYTNYEIVDKIIYINPKGANTLQLVPQSFKIEQDYTYDYVDHDGNTNSLGDHKPVVVTFKMFKPADPIDYYHEVTIGSAKYATLSLPWNATIPSGVTAYTSDCYHANNHQIDLQEVNGILPASTGVILYSETPATYRFYYTDSDADEIQENILEGTESGRLEPSMRNPDFPYYVLANKSKGVGMYRLGENTAIPQYRAYLKLSSYDVNVNTPEHVRFFINQGDQEELVSEDGGFADAINKTSTDENTVINIYSPNGTRLDKMQKGVNIVRMSNGVTKKIIK